MSQHRITTVQQLESLYGTPQATSLGKEMTHISPEYQRLMEHSPFFAIASQSQRGLDVSPRGDAAGFVRVVDAQTIAIPDRRGNNRIDTLRNIVAHPQVALLFLIPGLELTLRYNGRAHLSTDTELLETFAVDAKLPVCAIVVELDVLFFQCARALKRAKLWNPDVRIDPKTLPSTGQLAKAAMQDFDANGYDAILEQRQRSTLY